MLSLQRHCILQVALAWAATVEPEEGTQLLIKLGLLEPPLEYALECGAFVQALQQCQAPEQHPKMTECNQIVAMYLEDEGKLTPYWIKVR